MLYFFPEPQFKRHCLQQANVILVDNEDLFGVLSCPSQYIFNTYYLMVLGFLGVMLVIKNLPAKAEDAEVQFDPWVRRIT